jgi:glycine/D-amino acid oxidase-like deaminating enzyme
MEVTSSFWLKNLPDRNFCTTDDLPSQTDVVVVGGGIAGVSTAYWLSRSGVEVTLLEQRGICGGATGRNGGHLNPRVTSNFGAALKKYGVETALKILSFTHQNTEALKTFVAEQDVSCDLSFSGLVWLALSPDELICVLESASALTQYGLVGEYWDAKKCAELMRSESFLGGIFYADAGQLWPAKLVIQMAKVAVDQGANLQTQVKVLQVNRYGSSFIVNTDYGKIKAHYVVYATNAWTRDLLPSIKDFIVPVRGQVLVTSPVPPLWEFGFSTNFGYEYCHQRSDGRLVLGGMRWLSPTLEMDITDDTTVNSDISRGLRDFLPKHFPDLQTVEVEQEWTGILGFSKDLNPLIGSVPDRPNEYIIAGFSGHGMALSFLAAKYIATLISDHCQELEIEAFAPSRFSELAK